MMAGITQKKLKSYISIGSLLKMKKEDFSVEQCCQKDEKVIERRLNN